MRRHSAPSMSDNAQVFEHEVLRVGQRGLTPERFSALVLFNQRHQDRFFVVRHESLKFTSYVGVLQVGGLTLEILPKADRGEAGGQQKWRLALIDMLRACGYLKLAAASEADLYLRRASLFDLYMESFLDEAERLFHEGLVKKYRQRSGEVRALKGRIVFSRQMANNIVHREIFHTVHQAYDRNNVFNQVLCKALDIVGAVARAVAIRRRAQALRLFMNDVATDKVLPSVLDRMAFDTNTERYRAGINLARLIILNYQPDVRTGSHDVLAIMFDMNDLFEEYVAAMLRRAAALEGGAAQLGVQQARPFWRAAGTARHIRPDLLVSLPGPDGQRETVVLDTKWKLPATDYPDDSDLKQMYAYNLQFGAVRSYLLYPRVGDRADVSGGFEPPAHDDGFAHACGMWFAPLFEGDRINRRLGHDLLARLHANGL